VCSSDLDDGCEGVYFAHRSPSRTPLVGRIFEVGKKIFVEGYLP
jgi:hypothetical protein